MTDDQLRQLLKDVTAVDRPRARAERRSSILNATRMNSMTGEPAVPKFPLGREPGVGSAD